MKILDACCGGKMFWYKKDLPFVVYQDIRTERKEYSGGRIITIQPDKIGDVTKMDYEDETFDMVIFDPPHLIHVGENSWLNIKYGHLPTDYKEFMKKAFEECFRVLKENGTLVFKWSENQITFKEIVKLSRYIPLIGDKRSQTRWTVFVKNSFLKRERKDS